MIRTATLNDLNQLTVLFDLYRQFYKQESNLNAANLFLQERLSKKESIIFVASPDDQSDKLIGFVQLYPAFSSIGLRSTWILNDLYVDSAFRGTGFGEGLITSAVAFSKNSGARNLMLQTAVTNETAQKLYERLGWKKDDKYFSYYLFH